MSELTTNSREALQKLLLMTIKPAAGRLTIDKYEGIERANDFCARFNGCKPEKRTYDKSQQILTEVIAVDLKRYGLRLNQMATGGFQIVNPKTKTLYATIHRTNECFVSTSL